MFRPGGEAVLVGGVLFLEALDALLVLEEKDGAVPSGEAAIDLALGRGELVCGHDGLEHVQRDLPQLLVLVSEEENRLQFMSHVSMNERENGRAQKEAYAGGLDVEGGGRMLHGGRDDLLNLRVRDGRLGGDCVDGAAGLDGLEERSGPGHVVSVGGRRFESVEVRVELTCADPGPKGRPLLYSRAIDGRHVIFSITLDVICCWRGGREQGEQALADAVPGASRKHWISDL